MRFISIILFLVSVLSLQVYGGCPVAHTHIGVNPSWRPTGDTDQSDNNKLWFFSLPPAHPSATPGWPNWEQANGDVFLQLVPVLDVGNLIMKGDGSGKYLWTCKFMYSKSGGYGDPSGTHHLDGWHSAHPGHGMWNLESVDQQTTPQWDIYIKREGSSVGGDDFFMLLPNDTPVLTADGDAFGLGKSWLEDKAAWGFHEHMSFNFWLEPGMGQEVSATFSAYDTSGMYKASDNFEFTFVTVPEPTSILFLGLGVIALLRKNQKKCNA